MAYISATPRIVGAPNLGGVVEDAVASALERTLRGSRVSPSLQMVEVFIAVRESGGDHGWVEEGAELFDAYPNEFIEALRPNYLSETSILKNFFESGYRVSRSGPRLPREKDSLMPTCAFRDPISERSIEFIRGG